MIDPNQYEWLKSYDGSFNWYDSIPKGWRIAFGEMMVKEIDDVVKKNNIEVGGDFGFRILEIKEKWGELRVYCGTYEEEIERIIDNYSVLSGNICISCGKPDVPYTKGYILPICKECFDKDYSGDYEVSTCECTNPRMVDSYTVHRNDGNVTYSVKELADRIRERWKENLNECC